MNDASAELDQLKAESQAAGSDTVVRYGVGVVAFEERMNDYVIRYEAESVPQLIDLIRQIEAERKKRKAESR